MYEKPPQRMHIAEVVLKHSSSQRHPSLIKKPCLAVNLFLKVFPDALDHFCPINNTGRQLSWLHLFRIPVLLIFRPDRTATNPPIEFLAVSKIRVSQPQNVFPECVTAVSSLPDVQLGDGRAMAIDAAAPTRIRRERSDV